MGRPKGSKNQPKKATKLEAKVELMDNRAPFRTCYVCGRESRDLLFVPPLKHRHRDGCEPGSYNWLEYYEKLRLDKSKRTSQGEILYKHTKGDK